MRQLLIVLVGLVALCAGAAQAQPVVLPQTPLVRDADFAALVLRMANVELQTAAIEQRATATDARVVAVEQALSALTARVAALEQTTPTPVNCAGTWTAWQQMSCTACVSGQQTCSEQRSFVVSIPPSNSGTGCPISPEVRTVGQTCNTPPPPPAGDHDYFDALVARAEHWKSYSLRDQAQLQTKNNGGYARCNTCPLNITYDPANDPDPRKQDAAKMVIPAGAVSLRNLLDLPMGTSDGTTYLVTWDAWWGAEFDFAVTGIATYKAFQFDTTTGLTSSNGLGGSCTGNPGWFEVRARFQLAAGPSIARVDGRSYFPHADPIPAVGTFTIEPDRWVRYWVEIQQRASDTDLVSLWVADTQTDPVLIIDKAALRVCSPIKNMWIEMNTSSAASPPARVGYLKNVVMLRNVANPTSLMARPQ